ncbi:unnamed protein product [Symbiodinium sp. CCMP2592]|nr:unnamed protein product [Symbiodinium sp. CCMP2592]CAE7354256.1 unnamed protein product [Symbiodinium sp. CCMP2592]
MEFYPIEGGGLRVIKPIRYILSVRSQNIFDSLKPFVEQRLGQFRDQKVAETDLVRNFDLLKPYVVGHLGDDPAAVVEHRGGPVESTSDPEPEPTPEKEMTRKKLELDDASRASSSSVGTGTVGVVKDRQPLLPPGSYLKMDASEDFDELLGQEALVLGDDMRAAQWQLRASSRQEKAVAVLKRAAKKTHAVAAHESKKALKAVVDHPDEAQGATEHQCDEDVAMQDSEVAQGDECEKAEGDVAMESEKAPGDVALECEKAQGDVALECEKAQGDVALECEKAQSDVALEFEKAQGDVALECEKAQGDVALECEKAQGDVALECEKAQGDVALECAKPLPQGVLSRLVQHYTVRRPANPDEIHSQVLLRSVSELEEADLQERPAHMDVPVPDTPLKSPVGSLADDASTPGTVKNYRNTSSYKLAKSPIPFPLEGPGDVHMDEGDEATASGSNELVLRKELFPDMPSGSDEPMMAPLVMPLPEDLHDNPYSREAGLIPKREKESSVSIPTPQKPDTKKARLQEQAKIRFEMAEDIWSTVVYPLRDSVPDAMPRNLIFNGKLSYSVAVPDDLPSLAELWTPDELTEFEEPPVRKSIMVILNARTFYVNKSYFHEEFGIKASLTASSEQ